MSPRRSVEKGGRLICEINRETHPLRTKICNWKGGGGLLRGEDLVVHGVGAQTQGWIFRHLEAPASCKCCEVGTAASATTYYDEDLLLLCPRLVSYSFVGQLIYLLSSAF